MKMVSIAEQNEFGDVICPHCHANLMTPDGCDLITGEADCPMCGKRFRVEIKEE